jgi:hypothetical protein
VHTGTDNRALTGIPTISPRPSANHKTRHLQWLQNYGTESARSSDTKASQVCSSQEISSVGICLLSGCQQSECRFTNGIRRTMRLGQSRVSSHQAVSSLSMTRHESVDRDIVGRPTARGNAGDYRDGRRPSTNWSTCSKPARLSLVFFRDSFIHVSAGGYGDKGEFMAE